MAAAPYTAQAALTQPAGATQISTTEAAMHKGSTAKCIHPRSRGLRMPKASTPTRLDWGLCADRSVREALDV
jgi:hypothetical protein